MTHLASYHVLIAVFNRFLALDHGGTVNRPSFGTDVDARIGEDGCGECYNAANVQCKKVERDEGDSPLYDPGPIGLEDVEVLSSGPPVVSTVPAHVHAHAPAHPLIVVPTIAYDVLVVVFAVVVPAVVHAIPVDVPAHSLAVLVLVVAADTAVSAHAVASGFILTRGDSSSAKQYFYETSNSAKHL
ncbi:hypothetical protein EUX98_g9040 [Antrodiella citrinella]|uniref:Uncharacterized protein n=1 Tax=Antrodiella citrinella TaxID=2447956 RepID=A0A4S4LYY6_9APHY|nr:hypothetical protein EUX98_g9040 [Antrodiella citrinella]